MKKDRKFLIALELNLSKLSKKNRDKIVSKYYDINKIRKIIKNVYPSSNRDIDVLKRAIDELNKKLDELKKDN